MFWIGLFVFIIINEFYIFFYFNFVLVLYMFCFSSFDSWLVCFGIFMICFFKEIRCKKILIVFNLNNIVCFSYNLEGYFVYIVFVFLCVGE